MHYLLELYETRATAGRLIELHELVMPTLENLARTLGCERAFVALLNPEQGVLEGAVLRVKQRHEGSLAAQGDRKSTRLNSSH